MSVPRLLSPMSTTMAMRTTTALRMSMGCVPILPLCSLSGTETGSQRVKGDIVLPVRGNNKADAVGYAQDSCKQHIHPDSKHPIWDGNVLYQAFRKAQKSAPWKGQTQHFEMDFLHQIAVIQKELKDRTYRTSQKNEFILTERGKTRIVQSSMFRDKVVRHAFCDNILEPSLRPKMIYDNCACIKGKGISMARKRFKVHMHRFHRKHGSDGYILLMDYSGYYDNLRHDKVLEAVENAIGDEYAQWLLRLVLSGFRQDVSFMTDEQVRRAYHGKFRALDYIDIPKRLKTGEKLLEKSVDIGDQCSQILGVFYPTTLDQYIKTVCGEKYYGRYMDDSYIISNSREHLTELLGNIRKVADALGIFLNEKKVRITRLSKPFRFLQRSYFMTASGKIVERINPKRLTVMRRKLKKLANKVNDGTARFEDVDMMYRSWRGAHFPVMSRIQRINLDNLYTNLFYKECN